MKLLTFLTLISLSTITATATAETSKPNIVLIVSDDQGYADTGFNGSKQIRTPRLDDLAEKGTVLEAYYVQPVCSPTRAALMTGRLATRTGVYTVVRPHAKWGLPLQERTLANALKEAGYTTAICGKWHLGEYKPEYRPTQRGFDQQYGQWFGAIDYFTHIRDGVLDWRRNDETCHDKGYSTHLLAKEACRVIDEQPADKPLFLYVPFNAAHTPMQVPGEYSKQFDTLKGGRRTYAGMVLAMDEAIGQIVDALKAKGMYDNTIIIFSSDNGGFSPQSITSNKPLRAGKGTIYEGGIRVCAFASWPGKIPAGKRIAEPLHAVDWYPTLVKLAGGTLEQKLPLDGCDIWPVLTKGEKAPREFLILPDMSPNRAAIRLGDWKLLANVSNQADADKVLASDELYNLADDLGEKKNLAESNPEKVLELKSKLMAHYKTAVPLGSQGAGGE